MSEKRNWDQDFPKTPESFKLALKQQVEKEMANENDRSEDIKKMVEINPSNTKKKRRKWVKIAVAAVALIGLMSGGVYAVTKSGVSALVGREVNEAKGESYLTTDMSTFNQTVIPGWPQTMIDIFGEERAAEVKGISEPLLTITQVYYDGLSLAFYARPTKAGRKYELGADRLVIGDAVYMIHFNRLSEEDVEGKEGIEAGDYVGNVQLGGRDLPDLFTAELVLGAGEMRQTVSFDVQIDQKPIIKPSKTITISDGVQASVDALKIAESGTYIHVTWEFDESQKELYDKMSSEGGGNQVVFMALDDNNGNHFTTEDNMDTRQTIVFTVDGDDWSGAEQRKSYEADGKYYREMFGIIEGMNQDVTSLTVTPYVRTGVEDGEEHTYTNLDFAAFTVEYDE
ncbi:MAG: DUF4179 domain-containing protein [Coprococcus catus]|nr:DUF4179 domain-containing protein [Coprococcus catus]